MFHLIHLVPSLYKTQTMMVPDSWSLGVPWLDSQCPPRSNSTKEVFFKKYVIFHLLWCGLFPEDQRLELWFSYRCVTESLHSIFHNQPHFKDQVAGSLVPTADCARLFPILGQYQIWEPFVWPGSRREQCSKVWKIRSWDPWEAH